MNLKEARKKQGLTQVEVAIACGVGMNTYILWERGVSKPKAENLKKLQKVLKLEKVEE